MEQFNKALSFILGLVVVAVFIVVASGKFNIKGVNLSKTNTTTGIQPTITPKPTSKPWFSWSKPVVTPTAKPTIKPTNQPTTITQVYTNTDPNYHSYSGTNTLTSIPSTGIPIVLFPLFGTSLLTGIFMRKTGKRD